MDQRIVSLWDQVTILVSPSNTDHDTGYTHHCVPAVFFPGHEMCFVKLLKQAETQDLSLLSPEKMMPN